MADVLSVFSGVRAGGDGWTARCPAHEDERNSLSIGRGDDDRWLLKCHAGCTLESILFAAHLTMADISPPRSAPWGHGSAIVATYDYPDETGAMVSQSVRFEPKNFRQRRPDGPDRWIWNLTGVRRVPYRLNQLKGRKTVMIVEGEKDADRLWSLGIPATTNAGGAGKWKPEHTQALKASGCQHVIILPDNDPAGEAHGRAVAHSCVDAGLEVKLIPLPGLPRKGDVSDYLQEHTKDDLLATVKDAPLFNPKRLVTAPQPIVLTSLNDLLAEPDDLVEYLVADRIPAGAVVLIVAPPKGGKSTFARQLALDVGRGDSFLGWQTAQGTVWLLIFQDKRSEVKKHFQRLGGTGAEPIRFFINQPAADLLPRLQELAEKERPALIVVDMLAGLLPVKDLNDYAQVTQRFEPLLNLSRASGATLLLLHHCSAHGAREGLDAVLGSTALAGSVDNILILKRTDQQRVLSSVQRIGPDLEPTIIVLDPETGRLERAGSKREFDETDLSQRIVAALAGLPRPSEPVPESWIQDNVEGRNADKVRVLRRLLGMGKVHRVGAGGRKDPYRYTLESSCSRNSESAQISVNGREPQLSSTPIDLFATSEVLVPMFPIRVWEQEEQEDQSVVRTPLVRTSSNHDSDSLVPEVPDTSQNRPNGTAVALKTPHKYAPDSCSQNSHAGADDERF
jgi:hypothetical protein